MSDYMCVSAAAISPNSQGKHTDRLLTVSYLPVNLIVIAAMVRWHAHVRPRLRILGGLAGFTLAISAVPLVRLCKGWCSIAWWRLAGRELRQGMAW